ncbi:glutamine synthetase III family protein [Acidiluteibacter ferrifornacis]|uniref:Glutamine synthetase type III n=1 Tax=Acidiluteibacter ferrifornacis TaxID=2692424 RepID=A0A6N9NNA8_9FLAO|nr:glutamine synthetase III [Acidiluteibacter ferrifornacis]NBG66587.1 glutamine synthetase type III [Acidiluteibacter ferrifornacis]
MSTVRFKALEAVMSRAPKEVNYPSAKVSDYYGVHVFDKDAMSQYMPKDIYKAVVEAIDKGTRVERKITDLVASSMKSWAMEKGCTHYTHWFQPLTGTTAEKHDAFFEPICDNNVVERFDGNQLVQQEPDASSLPNGGIRNTFEARGYTAWDPSSPAFIIGKTLCIPTIFISYTGESLDYKMPLLKALHAVDKAAVDVNQYFDKNVNKVIATLGWEQEYFLVDIALFNARPDLITTGRTVFGHSPAKGQELEDHYFGAIPERASAFMRELEIECMRLGIPVKTRHNEVAPNQFECAPIFEEANLAVDHNQLLMDIMDRVARKHNFKVLLHEKPYAGVNGSGKHNNWSLSTNTGVNLLSPGSTPKSNLRFLTFFINTIKAVHDNADLLRSSIATPGNEHRLGANEAPPAIISVFIGSQLTKVLNQLEAKVSENKALSADEKTELKLNIGKIPQILLDNTDRNRTSPFAFTGNKFEFRAVGSTANCANAMTIINTIVAKQLVDFKEDVDALISKGDKKDDAIFKVLRRYVVESKKIRFEGNGYGEEWLKEAAKRGLNNINSAPHALDVMKEQKTIDLFASQGVLTHRELEARHEIALDNYTTVIRIESRVMGDLAINHIIPVAIRYQNILINNVKGLKTIYDAADFKKNAKNQLEMIAAISNHIQIISENAEKMRVERKRINNLESAEERAKEYSLKVKPFFDIIRKSVDKLELTIDDEMWPLPKYRELLYTK